MLISLYAIGIPLIIYGWASRGPDGKRPASGIAMLVTGIVFVSVVTLWILAFD